MRNLDVFEPQCRNSCMCLQPFRISPMSTRHIVRISPLHTSILLTVIYCLIASIIAITALIVSAFKDSPDGFITALGHADFENVLVAILLNVVLVFVVALGVSMLYNFLAKYLGGVEITLDDD